MLAINVQQITACMPDTWKALMREISIINNKLEDTSSFEIACKAMLDRACVWYVCECGSAFCDTPVWSPFIQALLDEDAFIEDTRLIFAPRLFCLPIAVQIVLLKFVLRFKHELDTSDLTAILKNFELHLRKTEENAANQKLQIDHATNQRDGIKDKTYNQDNPDLFIETRKPNNVVIDCDSDSHVIDEQEKSKTNLEKIKRNDDSLQSKIPDTAMLQTIRTNLNELDHYMKERVFEETLREEDYNWLVASQDELCVSDIHTPRMSQIVATQRSAAKRFRSPGAVSQGSPANKRGRLDLSVMADSQWLSQDTCFNASTLQLSTEMQASVERLRLHWFGGDKDSNLQLEDLKIFCKATPAQIEEICEQLCVQQLSEAQICTALKDMATLANDMTLNNSMTFTEKVLLPHVQTLDGKAGREFMSAVGAYTRAFHSPVLETIFRPCLCSLATESEVSDLLVRLSKESLDDESRKQAARICTELDAGMTDAAVAVLHSVVDCKVQLDSDLIGRVINSLEGSSSVHADDLKFGKLILGFINKYGKQLTSEHKTKLEQLMESQRYFLKKTILTAIKRLR